jgi:hypothetical protein
LRRLRDLDRDELRERLFVAPALPLAVEAHRDGVALDAMGRPRPRDSSAMNGPTS